MQRGPGQRPERTPIAPSGPVGANAPFGAVPRINRDRNPCRAGRARGRAGGANPGRRAGGWRLDDELARGPVVDLDLWRAPRSGLGRALWRTPTCQALPQALQRIPRAQLDGRAQQGLARGGRCRPRSTRADGDRSADGLAGTSRWTRSRTCADWPRLARPVRRSHGGGPTSSRCRRRRGVGRQCCAAHWGRPGGRNRSLLGLGGGVRRMHRQHHPAQA